MATLFQKLGIMHVKSCLFCCFFHCRLLCECLSESSKKKWKINVNICSSTCFEKQGSFTGSFRSSSSNVVVVVVVCLATTCEHQSVWFVFSAGGRVEGWEQWGVGGWGGSGSSLYSHAGPGESQCFSSKASWGLSLSDKQSFNAEQPCWGEVVVVVGGWGVRTEGGQTQADVHGILMPCVGRPSFLFTGTKAASKSHFPECLKVIRGALDLLVWGLSVLFMLVCREGGVSLLWLYPSAVTHLPPLDERCRMKIQMWDDSWWTVMQE